MKIEIDFTPEQLQQIFSKLIESTKNGNATNVNPGTSLVITAPAPVYSNQQPTIWRDADGNLIAADD